MSPFQRTLKVDVQISEDSLECILEMAGYGIGYWAVAAEADDEARTYTITESEESDNKVHVLTYDQIIEAFWRIASGSHVKFLGSTVRGYAFNAVIDGIRNGDGDIDAGHVDSELADAIIQVAAFSEIIYG